MSKEQREQAVEKVAQIINDFIKEHCDNIDTDARSYYSGREASIILEELESLGYVQLAEDWTLPNTERRKEKHCDDFWTGYYQCEQDMITPKGDCVWARIRKE